MINARIDMSQLENHGKAWSDVADAFDDAKFRARSSEAIGRGARSKWFEFVAGESEEAMGGGGASKLHHVYEWDNVGVEGMELFDLEFKPGGAGGGGTWHHRFKPAQRQPRERNVPTPGHDFPQKAEYLETHQTVTITAQQASMLFFYAARTDTFVSIESVTISYPTFGQFGNAWAEFWQEGAEAEVLIPATNATRRAVERGLLPQVDKAKRTGKVSKSVIQGSLIKEWEDIG